MDMVLKVSLLMFIILTGILGYRLYKDKIDKVELNKWFIRNSEIIFLVTYCFMIFGILFGTPPQFILNQVSMSEGGRVGGTIQENSYPYSNSFQALVDTIGFNMTILFIFGLIAFGFVISQGIDFNKTNKKELVREIKKIS